VPVPERQTPPSQQPLQLPGPQPQLWLSHFWLVPQLTQRLPPEPQASLAVPGLQVSPLQQPVAQLEGLHADAVQTPAAQTSPGLQLTQGSPAPPQATVVAPAMQALPWQQPLQLPGPQLAAPSGIVIGCS